MVVALGVVFVRYLRNAEASNDEVTLTPIASEFTFSYSGEFYLKKPELEEYPTSDLPILPNLPHLLFDPCSCVEFIQAMIPSAPSGVGEAKNLKGNNIYPQVGGIIITNESVSGHWGRVLAFDDETVTFDESNYNECEYSQRTLRLDDTKIQDYYWIN